MRTYILAESPEAAISVSNAVSASGSTPIISNRRAKNYREMLDEISAQAAGAYDLFFMVTIDPVNASIDANKRQGMRAYFCDNQKYVGAARGSGANVIVLDLRAINRPEYGSIISSIVGSSMQMGKAASGIQRMIPFRSAPQQQQQPQPQYQPPQMSQKAQKRMIIEAKQKGGKAKAAEPDYAQQQKSSAQRQKTGLFGKIKDSLGIE